MKRKEKQYEDLIFNQFGQDVNYDKIRHQLIKVRDIMSASQPTYDKMTVKQQFSYAMTILIIVTQTTTKDLRQFSDSKNRNEVFKYSVNEDFVPPSTIELSSQKIS